MQLLLTLLEPYFKLYTDFSIEKTDGFSEGGAAVESYRVFLENWGNAHGPPSLSRLPLR